MALSDMERTSCNEVWVPPSPEPLREGLGLCKISLLDVEFEFDAEELECGVEEGGKRLRSAESEAVGV